MADFIPNKNGPNYREVRSEDGEHRAMFAPHWIQADGVMRMVHPACTMSLGQMRARGSDNYQPTIRIDHAFGPTSLVFVPSADELRALGQGMIETADQMVKDADDMLAAALAKRGEGGDDAKG